MSRWQRLSSLAAPISVPVNLIFSVSPHDWIESTFAMDPDGGSGVRELMHESVPVPLAIAFAAYLFRKSAPAPHLNERPYQSTAALNSDGHGMPCPSGRTITTTGRRRPVF